MSRSAVIPSVFPAAYSAIGGERGGAPDYLPTFIVEGDSRSAIVGAPTASPWPTQLRTALPDLGAESYVNAAVSGETVATMVGQYATQIAPHHTRSGTFTLMAGINDRSISSVATIATNIQTIAANAKAGFGQTFVALENIRNMGVGLTLGEANNLLLTAHAASPIATALIAPHCLLPASADFVAADQLHPSAAGNAKLATFVQKLLTETAENVTPIDPATFSGVQIAVDISDVTTLRNAGNNPVANGETIDRWNDRSANGIHLTATDGTKPVFSTANALRATFASQSLRTAANFARSGPFTVYGLLEDRKNAGTQGTWWADNRLFVARPAGFNVFGAAWIGEGPGNGAGQQACWNQTSTRMVYCIIYDGANSKFYIDGRLIWSGTLGALSTAGQLSLGALAGVSSLAWVGDIGGFSFHSAAHSHATVRGITKWYSDLGKTYFYPFAT